MSISLEDTRRLADLARLGLAEQELADYTKQLNQILDYAKELEKINTDNIEPMYTPLDGGALLREDIAQDFANRSQLLENAPEVSGTSFVVPKIL